MNKPSFWIVFVSFIILTSSLTVPLHNFVSLAEGQQEQSPVTGSLKNVTDLMKSNHKNSSVQLENKTVNYFDNASGYLVYPIPSVENNTIAKNTFPAVIMIHENKGLNDNIKNMANLLAKEGYVILAVDLFNGEVTKDQKRASELTQAIRDNPAIAIANLKSAVTYLGSLANVNPDKIASLGWCFGGQQSLQLALNSKEDPLSATVIYYGRLVTEPETLLTIQWPVLGIFGDQDKSISVDSVKQFEEALNTNGIPNEIYIYEGVAHAFANPSGDNYAQEETQDAWEKTVSFLKKYLG
ncbi:MAG TPA: dienelactone hydrolase family protein [Nitrososphaeraceae archaeon]|nr:dienelactone hydrolase family protein [Nitrososphaeraceae archaeon]